MYCTLDDIKKQIPGEAILQLTDDNQVGITIEMIVAAMAGTEQPDPDQDPALIAAAEEAAGFIGEAIAGADSEIDGYCSVKYSVPFAVVPAVIKKVSADLAIYNLYARRVETMPEVRADNRKNSIALLKDISRGMVKLGEVADSAPTQKQQSPMVTSSPRLFGRDKMKGL
jgi:phage gp36-like protein